MKIKIKDNASKIYWNDVNKIYRGAAVPPKSIINFGNMLEKINGMTIDVETKYLFKNQFNTVPIQEVSERGMRIMEEYVEKVIDDERPGKARCNQCGNTSNSTTVCSKCNKSEYLTIF
jgi:hypothetical protein